MLWTCGRLGVVKVLGAKYVCLVRGVRSMSYGMGPFVAVGGTYGGDGSRGQASSAEICVRREEVRIIGGCEIGAQKRLVYRRYDWCQLTFFLWFALRNELVEPFSRDRTEQTGVAEERRRSRGCGYFRLKLSCLTNASQHHVLRVLKMSFQKLFVTFCGGKP